MSQLPTGRSKSIVPNYHNQYRPKHLQQQVPQRKKRAVQKLIWKQPIGDKIRRQQQVHLKPLNDLQTIMKHFKYKLGYAEQQNQLQEYARNQKFEVSTISSNAIPTLKKRRIENDACEVQKKIKTILSLPTIKKIKQQAKIQRKKIETQGNYGLMIFKDMKKKQILEEYNKYIMGEVRRKDSKQVSRFKTEY